jgi:hypothetical protein
MFTGGISSLNSGVRACVLAGALLGSSAALADAVNDWGVFADGLALGAPPQRARTTAIMYVAMHDALNSIQPRYESYTDVARARPGASPDAAVGEAAYRALKGAAPAALGASIDAFYNTWYRALPACPSAACADGVSAGELAANAILALRSADGSATPHLTYSLPPGPGVYQMTPVTPPSPPNPPAPVAPQFAGWANVTPFVLNSGSQFRAEPSLLFDLKSWAYTRDYKEVKRVGDVDSEAEGHRTADQSEIARFWPGGGANINAVARVIIAGRSLDLWESARLFALVNMGISDSTVAVFDTKFTYNFWRPVTAIRAGDTDGNPHTAPDADWLSYQNTPPYPDYTCGLPNNVGSGLAVLRSYFGTDRIGYTLTTPGGITRSFKSLSQAGFEAVDARVFGGMHFRTGCVRGLIQGGQVGRYAFHHALRPLKHGSEPNK